MQNIREDVLLDNYEQDVLKTLNSVLGLNLDLVKNPKGAITAIVDEVLRRKWQLIDFHANYVSAGTICRAALKVCGESSKVILINPIQALKTVSRLLK